MLCVELTRVRVWKNLGEQSTLSKCGVLVFSIHMVSRRFSIYTPSTVSLCMRYSVSASSEKLIGSERLVVCDCRFMIVVSLPLVLLADVTDTKPGTVSVFPAASTTEYTHLTEPSTAQSMDEQPTATAIRLPKSILFVIWFKRVSFVAKFLSCLDS